MVNWGELGPCGIPIPERFFLGNFTVKLTFTVVEMAMKLAARPRQRDEPSALPKWPQNSHQHGGSVYRISRLMRLHTLNQGRVQDLKGRAREKLQYICTWYLFHVVWRLDLSHGKNKGK